MTRVGARRSRFVALGLLATAALVVVGASVALAFWTASDSSNPATAVADRLPQGAQPSATVVGPAANGDTVTVSFAQAESAGGVAVDAADTRLRRAPAAGGASTVVTATCTGTGTGTGQSAVGTSGDWTVAQQGAADGTMYPGAGTSTLTFRATNSGTGHQAIESGTVTAEIKTDGSGNITEEGTAKVGCLASWFNAGTPDPGVSYPIDKVAGGHQDFTVAVTMDNSTTVNQDACKSTTPDVIMSVVAPS